MLLGYMASVLKRPSDNGFLARFKAFDRDKGDWRWMTRQTYTHDRTRAQQLADEYQKTALDAVGSTMTRAKAHKIVERILEISGVDYTQLKSHTWGDAFEHYLKTREIRDATIAAYRLRAEVFINWLGTKPELEEITPQRVFEYYEFLQESYAMTTANKMLSLVGSIFDHAVALGWVQTNPVGVVQKKSEKPLEKQPFTSAEVARLLMVSHGSEWHTAILFGLCTGQRISDCVSMQASQFDWKGSLRFTTIKTSTKMEIPVVEPLLSHLRRTYTEIVGGPYTPTLLKKLGQHSLSHEFRELMDRAGVEYDLVNGRANKSFHSFRVAMATKLRKAGVDAKIARSIVGHSSSDEHEKYVRVDYEDKVQALQKII